MKIAVVGTGYVGLSLSILLSQKYEVVALDINKVRVDSINNKISPIKDKEIESFLSNKKLNLIATCDPEMAYKDSDYVIIATPTNYDNKTGSFDTTSIKSVISDAISFVKNPNIVIKSTIPYGFTDKMKKQFNNPKIFFSPEFLREGSALHDNLYPSRIVIGDHTKSAKIFGELLLACSNIEDDMSNIHYMDSKEAEAVKLFSNTYLAMRIAFFNELDTFSEVNNISSRNIISGVCDDPRIGNYYNNPSFGYGGYCLPKDVKQLLDNYSDIPSNLISSVIKSNQTRKEFIVKSVLKKKSKSIGIYRLAMKSDSDNFRESASIDLILLLQKENIKISLYEPLLDKSILENVNLVNNLEKFIDSSDIILANRISSDLDKVSNKVYSRDIFNEN